MPVECANEWMCVHFVIVGPARVRLIWGTGLRSFAMSILRNRGLGQHQPVVDPAVNFLGPCRSCSLLWATSAAYDFRRSVSLFMDIILFAWAGHWILLTYVVLFPGANNGFRLYSTAAGIRRNR